MSQDSKRPPFAAARFGSTGTMKHGIGLALLVGFCFATAADAALKDHGPADATLTWPQWYRDLNGTPVGLCKSQTASPNSQAGGAPMCFPLANDPAGFAGNVGPEVFYNYLRVPVGSNVAAPVLSYTVALEASYLPGPAPVHGQETVFARIRITADITTPGTYTVTHPFGVEVFPNVSAGRKAINFTQDIPLGTPGDFDSALNGRLGPFIEWDSVGTNEKLSVVNASGVTEQFLGDPNYLHVFKGSPFGTNFVRVDGPVGANLDGGGGNSFTQTLGYVLGQKWTTPIATPFEVKKAVYTRDASLNTVDVWASSDTAQKLVVTGAGMPSIELKEFTGGDYYGHIEYPASSVPPAAVTVTNTSSAPVIDKTVQLGDQLEASAVFDPATRALNVTASSSDLSGPVLTVLGAGGGIMTPIASGSYTYTSPSLVATAVTPRTVNVQSNAGGLYQAPVVVKSGLPMNKSGLPIAVDDKQTVDGQLTTNVNVAFNDTFGSAASVLILSQPASGSAAVGVASGTIDYTPKAGAAGDDQFTYAIKDANGISNRATVTVTVPFVAFPPTANADSYAIQTTKTRSLNVLANDVAAAATTLDPNSIKIAATPLSGTATPNNGAISFTAGSAAGTYTFKYNVANTAATRSNDATVTMVAFPSAEVVTLKTNQYTVSKSAWSIVGQTTWFSTALPQLTATCWLGTANASTASTLIGTAPIDTTGKFQLAAAGTALPKPLTGQSVTCQSSSGGIVRGTVTLK